MGVPEEYDWALTPEAIQGIRAGFSVSVSFEIGPHNVEAVALLAGLDVAEVSQEIDQHLMRGTE